MGLFSFFKRKKQPGLKPLKTERVGLGYRLAKANQAMYVVKVAVTYEGKPVRQAEFNVKANSRDQAAADVQKNVAFKVVSAHKHAKRPKGPR